MSVPTPEHDESNEECQCYDCIAFDLRCLRHNWDHHMQMDHSWKHVPNRLKEIERMIALNHPFKAYIDQRLDEMHSRMHKLDECVTILGECYDRVIKLLMDMEEKKTGIPAIYKCPGVREEDL